MKVLSVSAKNYRTLVDFNHSFDKGYCAISGPNNAGKSCVIRIIQHFLEEQDWTPFISSKRDISFESDKTQWVECNEMVISVCLEINRNEDSETFFFVEKFTAKKIDGDRFELHLRQVYGPNKSSQSKCFVGDDELDEKTSSAVFKMLKSAANIVIHNSTSAGVRKNFFGEGFTQLADSQIDSTDKKSIKDAENNLKQKISKVAKKQTDSLTGMLARLDENYVANLTTVDSFRLSALPLAVSLQAGHVQGPLQDWGSGTRNRTEILMSLMEAARIKAAATEENRTTPVVVLEEPESFLHPLAQAEFGKLLGLLSAELDIQIIATTHSPYMLNHRNPASNTLLQRKIVGKKLMETLIVDTSEQWMEPFSRILGIIPEEFSDWRDVLGVSASEVILVEGETDKKYFEFFRDHYPNTYQISSKVEIESYGGKDALQNAAMLRFARSRFKKMFITFDLDAKKAVERSIKSLGLKENVDYLAIGLNSDGADNIEGLVPKAIVSEVYAAEPTLIQQFGSPKAEVRKSAKNKIKDRILQQLKASNLKEEEFSEFKKIFSKINKGLKSN